MYTPFITVHGSCDLVCALWYPVLFFPFLILSFCANHKKLCIQFKLNPQHSTPLALEDEVTVDESENTTHADNHAHTDDGGAVNTEADEPVQPAGATAITAVVVAVFGAMAAAMF